MTDKKYLSFGAGVNSVALLLLMLDEGLDFETVFVNHGCDHPKTYEYVEYLKEKGFDITEIKPDVIAKDKLRFDNIYDYFYHYKSIPLIQYRICTDKFKVTPFNKYIKKHKPCTVYLGYDKGEFKRVARQSNRKPKGIEYVYPLWEQELYRDDCKQLILDHGLTLPIRSGCWFCPFQSKKEWIELQVDYPDLFEKALLLERNSNTVGLLQGTKTISSIYQENKLTNYLEGGR